MNLESQLIVELAAYTYPKGLKYVTIDYRVLRVSILGIVIMVLGRYLIVAY